MKLGSKNTLQAINQYRGRAANRLSRFKKVSSLAIAMTAFILFIQELPSVASTTVKNGDNAPIGEAQGALNDLLAEFLSFLPKIAIASGIFLLTWALFRLFRFAYDKSKIAHQRRLGVISVARVFFILLGCILSLTVLVGDVRALLGSVGLISLALSWALQQPIESFSGYLLNAFRMYYRIGDRIEVGSVYGDVYRVDFLTTTVWETGAPGKSVSGAQPTGALITFPNSEILRANIVNYSRDFPFIWDEVTIGISNESDLGYAVGKLKLVADELFGESMRASTTEYQKLLTQSGLDYHIEEEPQVYLSAASSWTDCTVRYLVELRKRRAWSSLLYEKLSLEIARADNKGKIIPAYPTSIVYTSPNEIS